MAMKSFLLAFAVAIVPSITTAIFAQEQGAEFFQPRFVITQHVILLEGRQIVTWEKIDELISTFPNPQKCRPQLYFTRSASEGGMEKIAKVKIWELHKKYRLSGHSIGGLWPQADARYDKIRTEADLVPNDDLKKTGMVVFKGLPLANAEVLLIPKTDDEAYSIYMQDGQTQNSLEHIVTYTDNEGRFNVYPDKDTSYWLVAIQPQAGFRAMPNVEFTQEQKLILLPWGKLNLTLTDVPGEVQYPNLRSRIASNESLPTIELIQGIEVPVGAEAPKVFQFKFVPSLYPTDISRCFQSGQGTSHCLPGASVSLDVDDEINLTLGPLSEKQKARLKESRQQ
ncbi:hypothetical protein [Lacunimicrobium album]